MADTTAASLYPRSGNIVVRALSVFWRGLVYLGETSARARMLEQISHISDADLAKRGISRHDMILRVMTNGHYM